MAIEKKFVKTALEALAVKDYLYGELERAGVSDIVIQKTPIATRITAYVRRPGLVVGKKGKAIKDVCEVLQKDYGIENPQFEVIEVSKPSLDAKLVAEKIGKKIEIRPNIKPIMRIALNEVMEAGALGAEIRISGKIIGKGGKAKTLTARKGFLKKSGDLTKLVREGRYVAYLKAGAVGITVKIVAPGTIFPDKIIIPAEKPIEETAKGQEEAKAEAPAAEEAGAEEKKQ